MQNADLTEDQVQLSIQVTTVNIGETNSTNEANAICPCRGQKPPIRAFFFLWLLQHETATAPALQ